MKFGLSGTGSKKMLSDIYIYIYIYIDTHSVLYLLAFVSFEKSVENNLVSLLYYFHGFKIKKNSEKLKFKLFL
jgi:hypothetical protein